MAVHSNYEITIKHPVDEIEVDALVSFYFYKGHEDSWDEPGCPPELELHSCTVAGEDVLSLMEAWQVEQIEGELLAVVPDGDSGYNEDDYSYNEEY